MMMMTTKFKNWLPTCVLIGCFAVIFGSAAFGQDQYSVIIQQSPLNGGQVTPVSSQDSVYKAGMGESVTISATPNPGYRFVYWMGDVDDATANQTTVSVDGPKILIAVFERSEFEFEELQFTPPQIGSGGGGRRGPAPNVAIGRPSGGGRRRRSFPKFPPQEPSEESDDVPVPAVVPEPATVAILGLGFCMVRRMRNKRNC